MLHDYEFAQAQDIFIKPSYLTAYKKALRVVNGLTGGKQTLHPITHLYAKLSHYIFEKKLQIFTIYNSIFDEEV